MVVRLTFRVASALVAVVTSLPSSLAHMELRSWPYALKGAVRPVAFDNATQSNGGTAAAYGFRSAVSTVTIAVDCPATVTVTLHASQMVTMTAMASPPSPPPPPVQYTTTAAACTGTAAGCPCAPGYGCLEIAPCTWACRLSSTMSTQTRGPAPVSTPPPPPPPSSSPRPSTSPAGAPFYVPASDLSSYLPCNPGTFICTSPSTFYTCTQSSATSWSYTSPRVVAPGMMCLPNLAPLSSTSLQQQQAGVPKGYYRDDRYVRARPLGDCTVDGQIQCTDGGRSFEVCDQGGWVDMGGVATGTRCSDGAIVAV